MIKIHAVKGIVLNEGQGVNRDKKERHGERKPPAKEEKDEERRSECRTEQGTAREQKGDGGRRDMKMVEEGKAGSQAGREEEHWQQGEENQHLLNKSIIDLHMWLHVSQHVFGDNS